MLKQPEKIYFLKIRSIIGDGDNRREEETWDMYRSQAGLQKAFDKWKMQGYLYPTEVITITGYEADINPTPILFKVEQ